jgi:plastocyanin
MVGPGAARTDSNLGQWCADSPSDTLGAMHPTGVASAAWVFAAAPSKVPFYLAGGLLAGWAVLLGATGLRYPEFPGSAGRARLVMLTTGLLVAATVTTAVVTAGKEGEAEGSHSGPAGAVAPSSSLRLTADPTGQLAYDKTHAAVKAGKVAIGFVNKSSVAHNVTIAKAARVVASTKTIQGATTTATANLSPGDYVFFCSVDAHRQAGMHGTLTVR